MAGETLTGIGMNNTAEPNAATDYRVFDGALPQSLYERVVRAVNDIGDENLDNSYNTTFWFPRDLAPSNLAEEVAVELIRLARPPDFYIGIEWWLGRLPYGKKLPMHFDRDLTRSRTHGVHEYPIYASILYLNSFPTSPTVILGQIPGADPRTRVPKKPLFRDSIEAVANRYTIFRGNLRHGVVPAEEGVSRPDADPYRLCLLVNYWHIRPMPPICMDYDGGIYARLREAELRRVS